MIRRSTVSGLLAVLGVAAVPFATHAQERREGRGDPGQMLRSSPVFVALDADKDGELSAKEIGNAPAALKSLDKSNAGKLSAQDLLGAPREGGGPGPGAASSAADTVSRIFAFDKDGDGKVTRSELPERMHGLIERGDSDKDGALSRAELTQLTEKDASSNRPGGPEGGRRGGGPGGPGGRLRWMPLIQTLDADQNGELSGDEIKNAAEALKKLDKNADGKLSEEELRPQFGGRGGRPGREGDNGGRGERRPEGSPDRAEPRKPRSPEPR